MEKDTTSDFSLYSSLQCDSPFFFKYLLGGADQYLGSSSDPMLALATQRRLSIATWNIAAINNNVRIKYSSSTLYMYISFFFSLPTLTLSSSSR